MFKVANNDWFRPYLTWKKELVAEDEKVETKGYIIIARKNL